MVADVVEEIATRQVQRVAWEAGAYEPGPDTVVNEEPLEIRVNGASLGVLMRTPGEDEALIRGFLLTEGVVQRPEDIARVGPCRVVEHPEAEGNVMLATLREGVDFDPARFRRSLFSTSSCGLCGTASIERALRMAPPLPPGPRIDPALAARLPAVMRGAQSLFEQTGGLHAAAGFTADGGLVGVHEDIGRHNAVDKLIGAHPRRPDVLVVSSRVSFEIAQKALAARIPAVVAVSAPSALAVALAERSSLTVAAFARGGRMVIYADAAGRLGPAELEGGR